VLATVVELGQTNRNNPANSAARASVVPRWDDIGIVEAAGTHVDFVREIRTREGELGATARNDRMPFSLELDRTGCPLTKWKSVSRTLNHVTNAAPVVPRQTEQWLFVSLNGVPIVHNRS